MCRPPPQPASNPGLWAGCPRLPGARAPHPWLLQGGHQPIPALRTLSTWPGRSQRGTLAVPIRSKRHLHQLHAIRQTLHLNKEAANTKGVGETRNKGGGVGQPLPPGTTPASTPVGAASVLECGENMDVSALRGWGSRRHLVCSALPFQQRPRAGQAAGRQGSVGPPRIALPRPRGAVASPGSCGVPTTTVSPEDSSEGLTGTGTLSHSPVNQLTGDKAREASRGPGALPSAAWGAWGPPGKLPRASVSRDFLGGQSHWGRAPPADPSHSVSGHSMGQTEAGGPGARP